MPFLKIIPRYSFLLLVFLTACATLHVQVEPGAQVNDPASATLTSLQAENDALSTQVAGLTETPGGTPSAEAPVHLSAASNPEEVRLALLNSHWSWRTLWADALITTFNSGKGEVTRHQIWIELPQARFRFLSGTPEGGPALIGVSNGETIVDINIRTGNIETRDMLPTVKEPFVPPQIPSEVIYPHPLSGQMANPLINLILPAGLAQRMGTYQIIGEETLASRSTLIVDWSTPDGVVRDRFWIDVVTGVILRDQNYGKGSDGQVSQEITVQAIVYDAELPAELFSLPLSGTPSFALDYTGTPEGESSPEGGTGAEENSTYGELYFFLSYRQEGTFILAHLPTSCVIDGTPCPEVETVPGTPLRSLPDLPVRWSPDGQKALLAQGDQLFLYQQSSGDWNILHQAESYSQLEWSPNGARIALIASQGGIQDIYVMDPDGTNVSNLTTGQFSEGERFFLELAWQDEQRLVFWQMQPGKGKTLVEINVDTGETIEQEAQSQGGKDIIAYSPDRQRIAFVTATGEVSFLSIANLDGSDPRPVASFPLASIWPVAWCPDGESIAFSVYYTSETRITTEVYIASSIEPGGLRQVYRGEIVANLVWGSDNSTLLVEAENDGYWRMYIVSLARGDVKPLQAPGVGLEVDWRGASWNMFYFSDKR